MNEIFTLGTQGLRGTRIVGEMIRLKRKPLLGRKWSTTQIQVLLTDRRVLGELPASRASYHRGIKKMAGCQHPVIPGYYPRAVEDDVFYAAKGGAGYYHGHRGRDAELPNVFKGLLYDAMSGERYFLDPQPSRSGAYIPKLKSLAIRRGTGCSRSFDYQWFERCILKELREIPVRDITGNDAGCQDMTELRGRLKANADEIVSVRKFMRENRSSGTLMERVLELEEEQRQLEEEMALAVHRAANPLAQAWNEQQSLAAAVEDAEDPDGVRVRLRQRLRETVDKIWLLVLAKKSHRHAVVQIDFKGSDAVVRRHYMFTYYPGVKTPRYSRPSRCEPVLSWRSDDSWPGVDLASREDSATLAEALSSGLQLDAIMALCSSRKR